MAINNNSTSVAGVRLPPGRLYGQLLSSRVSNDFFISEAQYDKGISLPEHSHELAFFCLLIEGCSEGHYPQRLIRHEPFTVTFHPPGESHRIKIGNSGARVVIVEILPTLIERLREYAPLPGRMIDFGGGELLWLSARLLREHRADHACSNLAIEGLILEMLALAACLNDEREKVMPSWVARVKELLHTEFRQSLTINYLATEAGVHPIHLSRIFRKHYHQTIFDYVNKLRVRFACQQLCRDETTITDIALSAGFCDQSHFTRIFKRIVGCTPGNFRAVSSCSRGLSERDKIPRAGGKELKELKLPEQMC